MIEAIIHKEAEDTKPEFLFHRHISKLEAQLYVNILNSLGSDRAVDDLWFPIRLFTRYVHRKRSLCSQCYQTFSTAYYNPSDR